MTPLVLLFACAVFVGLAAVWDVRTGHIPNELTFGGMAVGLCLQTAGHLYELGAGGVAYALGAGLFNGALGVVLCGLVPYLLFRAGAMGGGDVKLLAGVGAFVGPVIGLELELSAFIVMALFCPLRLAYEGKLNSVIGNSLTLIVNPFLPKQARRHLPREMLTAFKFGPAVLFANGVVILMHSAVL